MFICVHLWKIILSKPLPHTPQGRDEEAVGSGAQGRQPQKPLRRQGKIPRRDHRLDREIGVLRHERRDPILVFLREEGAGDIDQPRCV